MRGIPLALIGATAYFSAFSLATLAAFDYKLAGTLLTILVGLMFLTTLWLLYLQAFRHWPLLPILLAVGDRNHNPNCASRNRPQDGESVVTNDLIAWRRGDRTKL